MSTAGAGGLAVVGTEGGLKGAGAGGKMASTGDGVIGVVVVAGAGGGCPAVVSTGI